MIRIALFVLYAVALAAHAGEPETFVITTYSLDLAGTEQRVDVYRPAQASPSGVAILAHGFARSRVRHRDLARALAESGVIAIVPDLPNVVDLWGNGRALADFVTSLEEGAVPSLPVARDRIVLIGTSAGGLATLLAAARLPGIAGWIGLDPVDRTGTGMRAASQLASPAVVMLAEPSLCNLMTSGRSIAEALPHRLRTVDVTDASHCDFEDPTNNMCQALCGRSTEETRLQIRTEIVTTAHELLAEGQP